MLNKNQIQKFQQLYKNRFGEELSHEEAEKKGGMLIELIRLLYQPLIVNRLHELKQ